MEENPRFARRRQANVQGDMESKQIAPFSHFIRPLSYVSGGTGSVPNSTGSIPATTLDLPDIESESEESDSEYSGESETDVAGRQTGGSTPPDDEDSPSTNRNRTLPWPSSLIPKMAKKSKGANTRRRYNYEVKASSVALYDSLVRKRDTNKTTKEAVMIQVVHQRHLTSADVLSKWISQNGRNQISAIIAPASISDYLHGAPKSKGGRGKQAPGRYVFSTLKGRRNAKFLAAEQQLFRWFADVRKKGGRVTTKRLRQKMRVFVREHYVDENNSLHAAAKRFKASAGWIKRFLARYNLGWRRRNDSAYKSVPELLNPIRQFINKLRDLRAGDGKYGKYGLYNTFNVDQVPLPFASDNKMTIDYIGSRRVWIRSPGSGLEKRQCTLQLLIRPMDQQPVPCLIFKGTPTANMKRQCDLSKRKEETKRYWEKVARELDPDGQYQEGYYDGCVLVLWQKKAWADESVCLEWADRGFGSFIKKEKTETPLLLADNLKQQVSHDYHPRLQLNFTLATLLTCNCNR